MKVHMQKGFTLVEILIVMGIIMSLFGIGIFSFGSLERQSHLEQISSEIKSALSKAQSLCLNNSPSGVHFESDKFALYYGSSYDPNNQHNEITLLPNDIRITQINLNGGNIAYHKITGYIIDYISPANLTLQTSSGKEQVLNINKLGVVEVQ